jgi:hypothetical protein
MDCKEQLKEKKKKKEWRSFYWTGGTGLPSNILQQEQCIGK